MQKIFFALRAISYEGTQTCDRFTKNVESADRFTKNVDVDVDVERRVLVPRPLLVSGSPFLPPLSKRVSLLKIRFSRPPAETKKKPKKSFPKWVREDEFSVGKPFCSGAGEKETQTLKVVWEKIFCRWVVAPLTCSGRPQQ